MMHSTRIWLQAIMVGIDTPVIYSQTMWLCSICPNCCDSILRVYTSILIISVKSNKVEATDPSPTLG